MIDENGAVERVDRQKLEDMKLTERDDLQEWVIQDHQILGKEEEFLIITSEYAGFEDTLDRLDILALDPDGVLVVIELKRDRADRHTDLQAIKYASFCSTLTAEDIQKEYQSFHQVRTGDNPTPEEIGEAFANFVNDPQEISFSDEGWAQFELDNRPRIILAAGEFGLEVTSPVMWLNQEFGLDISCVRLSAYEHNGEYLIHGHRIIPVPEAEEFMTRRQEKQASERSSISPRYQAYLNIYQKLLTKYSEEHPEWEGRKPLPRNAYGFQAAPGDSGIEFAWAYRGGTTFGVELYIDTKDQGRNREIFANLKEDEDVFEREFDSVLWDDMEGHRAFRIRVLRDVGYAEELDEDEMSELVDWGTETMDDFRELVEPRLDEI